jgi:hypothetical protein
MWSMYKRDRQPSWGSSPSDTITREHGIALEPGTRNSNAMQLMWQGATYERGLPFGVLWLGFALDSIAFGFAWFLLIVFAIAIRRGRGWFWMRRGRCQMCGYDLRGTDHKACPECGAISHRQT